MERREFIKAACSLCVLLSSGLMADALSSCAPYPVYEAVVANSRIVVPISILGKDDIKIIRANNLDYDIALQRESNGSYTALLLRCTHASNPLKYTGSEFVCSLHGSTFNKEGNVTEGPAVHELKKLDTTVSDSNLSIIIN